MDACIYTYVHKHIQTIVAAVDLADASVVAVGVVVVGFGGVVVWMSVCGGLELVVRGWTVNVKLKVVMELSVCC